MPSEAGGRAPLGLALAALAVLLFLHAPFAVIALYALTTEDASFVFPPPGLTLEWFPVAWNRPDVWRALGLSLRVATTATGIALVLGTLAAAAVHRSRFFGREAVSFLLVLPIALPGIVTGIALRSALSLMGVPFSFWTVVVGHATFCVVVVYNNAVARMRRISGSLDEASMDLGADSWQTFRYVTAPQISTASIAGSLLAFALSFDEVIVTTFTISGQETLPIWILANLSRPNQLPIVNVVAVFVILLSIIPVWIAQRLASGAGGGGRI